MLEVADFTTEDLFRIDLDLYHRMVEAGLLDDARVELLGGVLVAVSPQGPRHAYAVMCLTDLLHPAIQGKAQVRVQLPLSLGDDSEPEPDFALAPLGDYRSEHPTTALFVVEASDSSLRKDTRLKAPLYAVHGVPEFWIVNLDQNVVVVHTEPSPRGYGRIETLKPGEERALVAFPDVAVSISAILGL